MARYYVIDCFGNVWGDTDNKEHAEEIIENNIARRCDWFGDPAMRSKAAEEKKARLMEYYEPEIIEEGR